jgi:DNA-binding SARP family transcriptional activator
MDPADANALGILETLRRLPRETHPVELDAAYLRAVERLEALPTNRSGTDKSWVEDSRREFREYFARARRAPHSR